MLALLLLALAEDSHGAIQVRAGGRHTCAISAANVATCWGLNNTGQLGDGTTTSRLTPAYVVGFTDAAAMAPGRSHTCAVTLSGSARCWGQNLTGQLGDNTTTDRLTPVTPNGLSSGIAGIAAGDGYSCARTTVGQVKCWGANTRGQLGDGSNSDRLTAVDVGGFAGGAVALTAGGQHTCIVTSDDAVWCWGANQHGQLGDGTYTDRNAPVRVTGLSSGVLAVAAGYSHTCALTSGGGVMCWGAHFDGQLGDGTNLLLTTPVPVGVLGIPNGAAAISAGADHTCALLATGAVKCWGRNTSGQLGDGTTTNRFGPVEVVGLASGIGLAAADTHTCALVSPDVIKCWGRNLEGQLADGTTTGRATPVRAIECGNGLLELAEACDDGNLGNSDCCSSTCQIESSATVCRVAVGECDLPEHCSGASPTCPSNAHKPAGTACSADLSVCSLDVCDGSGTCTHPAGNAGTTCRVSAGDCDVAEACDGVSTTCPADVLRSASYVCRSATGDCDVAETCDGVGPLCPSDALHASSHVCRTAAGDCDVPETCDGVGAACPADALRPSSHVCRAAAGDCDVSETCDGVGATCPPNALRPSSHVCRAAAGDCDVAETCDGVGATCPADALRPSSHVCRTAAGDCDVAETCSGADAVCPADSPAPAGSSCPDDGEACTSDACDGFGTCTHAALPDSDGDTVCDPQDPCTNVGGLRTFVTPPRSKLTVSKINTDTTPGNDKLTLTARFDLPASVSFADLDPRTNGARVLVESSQGTVIDVHLPPGSYEGRQTRGWKTNTRRTYWQYLDRTGAPLSGISDLKATDRSKGVAGGGVALTLKGKNATYPVTPGDLPLEAIVVLGNQWDAIAGKCGESAYGVSRCLFNGSGSTLLCVR